MFLTKYYRSIRFLTKHNLYCVALVLGITFVCGGITGCGNGDGPVTPTETETGQVTETVQVVTRYDGDDIYFELDGTFYEGRVVEGVSADEVLVNVSDGSDMIINVNDIGGTVIADHPDLGVKVKLLGEQGDEANLTGRIVRGYDDGVRKIEIYKVQFRDGTAENLDVSRIRFVHEDADFENGGYLTLEEFGDRFLN